ncbi:MAG: phosphatidate cytidylyltransferase [Candidatus Babeliales bacterium]
MNSVTNLIHRSVTGLLLGMGLSYLFVYAQPIYFTLFLLIVYVLIVWLEMPVLLRNDPWYWWMIILLYPTVPFFFLCLLNHDTQYRILLALTISTVFAFDTGSYLVGSLWGKDRIAPFISLGKTWQGFYGGYITVIVTLLFFLKSNCTLSLVIFLRIIIIALGIAFLALGGDLFESQLKRRAGVKHSGFLLPGHGGLLDRFDGLLWVAVAVYWVRQLLYVWLCLGK